MKRWTTEFMHASPKALENEMLLLVLGPPKGASKPLEIIVVFYKWRFRTSYELHALLAEKEELQKALILKRYSNCSTKKL